jgi:hypothetical protein
MTEANEVARLAAQASETLREAEYHLAQFRNKAVDTLGLFALIDSGNLVSPSAAIRVATREVDGQLMQLNIVQRDLDAFRRRL